MDVRELRDLLSDVASLLTDLPVERRPGKDRQYWSCASEIDVGTRAARVAFEIGKILAKLDRELDPLFAPTVAERLGPAITTSFLKAYPGNPDVVAWLASNHPSAFVCPPEFGTRRQGSGGGQG